MNTDFNDRDLLSELALSHMRKHAYWKGESLGMRDLAEERRPMMEAWGKVCYPDADPGTFLDGVHLLRTIKPVCRPSKCIPIVQAAADKNLTASEVAVKTGVPLRTIRRSGVAYKRGASANLSAERKDRIRVLLSEGVLTRAEIAAEMKCNYRTIGKIAAKIGLEGRLLKRRRHPSEVEQRVRALYAEKLPNGGRRYLVHEIRRMVGGISGKAFYRIIRGTPAETFLEAS
jgi:hypothetical protein